MDHNIGYLYPQEIKAAFVKEEETSGKRRLLIVAAVAAAKGTIDTSYEVAKIAA